MTDTPLEAEAAASAPQTTLPQATKTSRAWVVALLFLVVLFLLGLFILENSQQVVVSYFGANGHISLAVAMILAAVAGALLVAIPGAARVIQLRRTIKHHLQ